mmetsp:Transcript_25618/g.82967  ORF Transcript_25618/g.82967 Transcript_25618/m.82967 type:complete len:228 (-) Transcript_25618:897-1580(-)
MVAFPLPLSSATTVSAIVSFARFVRDIVETVVTKKGVFRNIPFTRGASQGSALSKRRPLIFFLPAKVIGRSFFTTASFFLAFGNEDALGCLLVGPVHQGVGLGWRRVPGAGVGAVAADAGEVCEVWVDDGVPDDDGGARAAEQRGRLPEAVAPAGDRQSFEAGRQLRGLRRERLSLVPSRCPGRGVAAASERSPRRIRGRRDRGVSRRLDHEDHGPRLRKARPQAGV